MIFIRLQHRKNHLYTGWNWKSVFKKKDVKPFSNLKFPLFLKFKKHKLPKINFFEVIISSGFLKFSIS